MFGRRVFHWHVRGWFLGLIAIASGLQAGEQPTSLPKPLPTIPQPEKNPATVAKIALGKKLFFDPQLSSNGKISCATCHDPARGFSNGKRFAQGVGEKKGSRHVPSLFNVAYGRKFFWDGRSASLEDQALEPIQNPSEMNMSLRTLVSLLNNNAEYRKAFQNVFGGKATSTRLAQAIAAYERTILSNDTPFDRFLKGNKQALSPAALRGMKLFFGDARCVLCHKGPNFSDDNFHNIGTPDPGNDPGRRRVTGKPSDQGKFKTPTLREVARTAPYMHNGHFKTLTEVVQHYNFGGVTDWANDFRDEQLQVLYLGEDQVEDLVTFLKEGLSSQRSRTETR